MYKDKEISEYLYRNYFAIIKHYSSLLPGELAKEKAIVGEENQFGCLKNLKTLLEIYIGDLSDELSDIIKSSVDYERRRFVDEYFN